MDHRRMATAALLEALDRHRSGRPRPELVLGWVRAMLEDDDVVDSTETAHAFRCDEDYVVLCAEVGVRRGDLQRCAPRARPPGLRPPVESWTRSRLDPLARLALEADFDEVGRRAGTGRHDDGV
jgi:hypothetical protein